MASVAFVFRGCRQATKVYIPNCTFHKTNCLITQCKDIIYVHLNVLFIKQSSVKHLTWMSVRSQSTAASVRLVMISFLFMYVSCTAFAYKEFGVN